MNVFEKTKFGAIALLVLASGNLCSMAKVPVHEVINDVTGLDIGTLNVGGCIRANYVYGEDYGPSAGPSKGDNGGTFVFDVYRLTADWKKDNWQASAEYRWHNSYNFFRMGWVGYNFSDGSQVQVGMNRVPFGVGPYGASLSWFFDMHYYVGLADDMDIGVKYSKPMGPLKLDLAYYASAEPNGNGATPDCARYTYDVIDDGSLNGQYREGHQFNVRARYSVFTNSIPTEIGVSMQVEQFVADSGSTADDTWGYAASVHSSSTWDQWQLMLQLSHYDYGADFNDPAASDDLITMGAFDWAAPVATAGTIPAAVLSYTLPVKRYDWLDSIIFYGEISAILKDGVDNTGNELNDSIMNTFGAAFSSGGWYITAEYANASGNFFVGPGGDFGANANDERQDRINIGMGYYF
ncbi:MAG: hypothetical protein JXR25_07080 [Pontiellaceae bacterium]|nr:hypothetical protein [Pontiellaceae bacterium]MBN2784574.1 hypothetical protein [Pontiellaceae bacterium]